jgi:nucleotide-binding universal stress UspA family protein
MATDFQFLRILCPVDFSEYSRTALRYGAALSRRAGGRLTVLFVNDPLLGSAAAAAAYDVRALEAKTLAELKRFVARSLGQRAGAAAITTALGHPAPAIAKAAEQLGADLIVMGSRGLTGPGKWLFGSTTSRVLRSTSIPLLVVPKPRIRSRARWASAMRSWPGKRVLVPVDLADYSMGDVRRAVEAVRAFAAIPVLVYVLPPVQFPAWLRVDGRTYERERLDSARGSLEKLRATTGGDAECQLAVGEPSAEIAAAARSLRAGLIVMTIKHAAAPFGPRQGTIAYRLLSSDVAPVLAIPGSREAS